MRITGTRISKVTVAALLSLLLTSCGELFRPGGAPLPGPTVSPTGTPTGIGTGLPGGPDTGPEEEPTETTTEEPDFPG
ncbi:MAG TPA: hypothetical protein VJ868_05210 [Actinomycetota bacterium]|nr:hypothetical protein [Actinomycetota bacterium]